MARKFNEIEYSQKRNDILDSALRRVYTVGYDNMAIQDILDDLKISKGAFYHYFTSKPDLLHGIITRMVDEVFSVLSPILENQEIDAVEKLRRYFSAASMWKSEHLTEMLPIFKVWYADENVLVREKIYSASEQIIIPILSGIIKQGIREGTMHSHVPDEAAKIVYGMMFSLGDSLSRQLLRPPPEGIDRSKFFNLLDEYTRVMEIALGMEAGTLEIFSHANLQHWIDTIVPVMQQSQ